MNLPIPTHLQQFFILIGNKNSEFEVIGKIHCSCRSEDFEVWESNERQIVKLVCRQCGQEILLLDNGKHGWNGFVSKEDFLDRDIPMKKFVCSKCSEDDFGVIVQISSQGKMDFLEECVVNDDSFSVEDWVDAFEWITISLSCQKCRWEDKKWVDLETM